MASPIVAFEGVTCRYGANVVLENVNLHLHKGQFAGILGPSGAGKTTLLKAVLGLLSPASGKVCVGGEVVNGRPSRRVGYVPQIETVDWNFPLTVEQAVLMGRTTRSSPWPWPSRSERELAQHIMERLGITSFAKRHIRELSGGQQQRIFLARALIAEPELLVLDEPTAGVDMRTQEDILHLLAELNQDGVTILMTTHDLNAAASHLPWVICLNHTVIAQGTPDQVFVPETLNATYHGDMIVVRQDGLIFVQERPHGHTNRDLIPKPVLSHPNHPVPEAESDRRMVVDGHPARAL
ncbi:MAG: metal ABC transporter ATP-binding protein [Anaerolineae bacterium]|nr:metal ABC transporter ATP-binding protein [Anaerolineae bacterium]